ncbi:MAG: toll/interleukin-1 receptor domain-containing protein [Burkholderiaceae bacterium]
MRGIFISYRRDDSEGQAGRLFDDLSAHFGRNAVFMDVAGIKKGLDFRRIIDAHVASCGVLLVIIGKRWLTATDSQGRRRLDDVNDFVCLETAAALSRDIPVVPVLVQDAVMPNVRDLPDALKELAFRNGTELTHARWDSDVKLLIEDLRPYLEEPATGGITSFPQRDDDSSVATAAGTPPRTDRRPLGRSLYWAGGAAAIAGAISIFGYHLLQDGPAAQNHTLAVTPTPPATQPQRRPEHTAPLVVAKLPLEAADEPGKLDPAAAQAEAAKAAAAKAAAARAAAEAAAARAASARAAAARKDADEVRRREEIERSTQLAEEQRKRDDDARRIAQAKAEQQRIAAEQAAAARMFTDIATAVLGSRQHNRR